MNSEDDVGQQPFLGDYPNGSYFSFEPLTPQDVEESEDHTVSGPVIRLMWDYFVGIPIWDAEGQLPEDPQWLRAALGLSDELIQALIDWCQGMNVLDAEVDRRAGASEGRTETYAEMNAQGRELCEWLQGELGARFAVRFVAW